MHKENENLPSRNTCTHVSNSEESEVEIMQRQRMTNECVVLILVNEGFSNR